MDRLPSLSNQEIPGLRGPGRMGRPVRPEPAFSFENELREIIIDQQFQVLLAFIPETDRDACHETEIGS